MSTNASTETLTATETELKLTPPDPVPPIAAEKADKFASLDVYVDAVQHVGLVVIGVQVAHCNPRVFCVRRHFSSSPYMLRSLRGGPKPLGSFPRPVSRHGA